MATKSQITTALLTEHFRYTPLTLLDDIINTVNELVFQAVNNIETALLNVPPDQLGFAPKQAAARAPGTDEDSEENGIDQESKTEIEAGIVKLESLLNSTIDKTFDKLEIYTLRNLLTVSNVKEDEGLEDWIMLDHYRDLQQSPSPNADIPTPESLDSMRRKVAETEKLQSILRAEVERNNTLLTNLQPFFAQASSDSTRHAFKPESTPQPDSKQGSFQPSFSFLTNTPPASALGVGSTSRPTALAQNTKFAHSQLEALKTLVASLRPHLASLPQKDMGSTIDPAAEARHAYIESQSNLAMARAGIDPDASAGAGVESLGRRPARDETTAIERIVNAMGGEDAQADRMEE